MNKKKSSLFTTQFRFFNDTDRDLENNFNFKIK